MSNEAVPSEKMYSETPWVLIARANSANPTTNIPLAAEETFATRMPNSDATAMTIKIAIEAETGSIA